MSVRLRVSAGLPPPSPQTPMQSGPRKARDVARDREAGAWGIGAEPLVNLGLAAWSSPDTLGARKLWRPRRPRRVKFGNSDPTLGMMESVAGTETEETRSRLPDEQGGT